MQVPAELYKFVAFCPQLEKLFLHSRIKFTAPADLDDPLECKNAPRWPSGRLQELGAAVLEEKRRKLGVCSLAECPLNADMWELYAGNQSGLCVRLSTQVSLFFAAAQRVQYREYTEYSALTTPISEQYDHIILTKSSRWQSQREWRLVTDAGPGCHPFPPICLTGVIFGLRTEEKVKEQVQAWLQEAPWVEFYQAEVEARSLNLRLQPLTRSRAPSSPA